MSILQVQPTNQRRNKYEKVISNPDYVSVLPADDNTIYYSVIADFCQQNGGMVAEFGRPTQYMSGRLHNETCGKNQ